MAKFSTPKSSKLETAKISPSIIPAIEIQTNKTIEYKKQTVSAYADHNQLDVHSN